MKIICDNCRTKYSIADEKVKGKVFKIRCKKCSNIIVVRGNQPEAEAQPDAGADDGYAGDAGGGDVGDAPTWHLVIDQKQVGPMTAAEVRDRYARGEIDAESYIWREGFSDWMRIVQVEDFADIGQSTTVAAPGAAAPDAGMAPQEPATSGYGGEEQPQAWGGAEQQADQWGGGAGAGAAAGDWNAGGGGEQAPSPAAWSAGGGGDTSRTDSDGLFGAAAPATEDPGQDLFGAGDPGGAAAAPAEAGGLFGAPGAMSQEAGGGEAGGGDLFGGGGGGQQLFPSEEEQPQPAAQMTGARNENSVLFSLSNLQALAMGGGGGGGGGGAAPAPAKPAAGGAPADGSGLIDIRSMAGISPSTPKASTDDGLPDLGGFSAPIAAAPVLIPAGSDERPKWLLPTIIGGSVVLVGAIVALVLVLTLRKPEPVYVASATGTNQAGAGGTSTPSEPAKAETKEAQPAAGAATKTEEGKTEEGKTEEGKTEEGKASPGSTSHRRHRSRRRSSPGRKRPSHKSSKASSDPILGGSSKPKSHRKHDALDDLIDGAVGSEKRASKPKARHKASSSADSNLPETLSRAQIQGGMRGIKGRVQGCYDRYKVPGMANVQVKIGRNGRVGSARVVGMFAGTPTGACVQAAARSARFSKFKGSPITITYPFILR